MSERKVPFCVSRERFADGKRSYLVDGWFGAYGEPSGEDASVWLYCGEVSVARITEEANVGRARCKSVVEGMFERAELWQEGGRLMVESRAVPPYVSIPASSVRAAIAELTERQFRCWLWAMARKRAADRAQGRCKVFPVWLVRDLGLSECHSNVANVKRAMSALAEKGLVRYKASGRAWEIVAVREEFE